jgi:hypothetical protein
MPPPPPYLTIILNRVHNARQWLPAEVHGPRRQKRQVNIGKLQRRTPGHFDHHLRWLDRRESEFNIRDFDISPDGREIVLERMQERSDVVLLDLGKN